MIFIIFWDFRIGRKYKKLILIQVFRASNSSQALELAALIIFHYLKSDFDEFDQKMYRLHVWWFPREAPIASRDPPSERQKTVSQGSSMVVVLVWWFSRTRSKSHASRGNDSQNDTQNYVKKDGKVGAKSDTKNYTKNGSQIWPEMKDIYR